MAGVRAAVDVSSAMPGPGLGDRWEETQSAGTVLSLLRALDCSPCNLRSSRRTFRTYDWTESGTSSAAR
jgi:hypothetical protein